MEHIHVQRMKQTLIQLHVHKYRRLVDETYEDQEEGGRRGINIRGRNKLFA
jgi:hypothetical protein